jgi:hypothetical protein
MCSATITARRRRQIRIEWTTQRLRIELRQMAGQGSEETELWFRASVRNSLVFAVMLMWPLVPIVFFLRRLPHGKMFSVLLVIPWSLFSAIIVLRPEWVISFTRWHTKMMERTGESLEKRIPPGFP